MRRQEIGEGEVVIRDWWMAHRLEFYVDAWIIAAVVVGGVGFYLFGRKKP